MEKQIVKEKLVFQKKTLFEKGKINIWNWENKKRFPKNENKTRSNINCSQKKVATSRNQGKKWKQTQNVMEYKISKENNL